MHNKIFILSGPAGVGKTSVAIKLLKKHKNLKPAITYTTRVKRKKSVEDKKIFYISKSKFEQMIKQNKFLEWQKFHDNYYGTAKKSLDELKKHSILLNIDTTGALQIKKQYKDAVLIFIKPDSIKNLTKRILKRGKTSEKDLKLRLQKNKKDLKLAKKYNYRVINYEGKLEQTVAKIEKIIRKELNID